MTNRLLFEDMAGEQRLRFSRPGYDVLDPNLTNEQLVFDSAWHDTLKLYRASWGTQSGLTFKKVTLSSGGTSTTFSVMELLFGETLPFVPIALGWSHRDGANVRKFTPVIAYNDRIQIVIGGAGPVSGNACSYLVFYNPMEEARASEGVSGGVPRISIGNHPVYGSGLFISRRGVDVDAASLQDMILSTYQPAFQLAEAGQKGMSQYVYYAGSGATPATFGYQAAVDLAQAYPDRPPVICTVSNWGNALTTGYQVVMEVTWQSDTRFIARIYQWESGQLPTPAPTLQWAIPKYDLAYVPENVSAGTPRILMSAGGLKVSRKGVNVETADASGLLLDTSASMLHVAGRGTIPFVGAENKVLALPTTVSGIPIVIYAKKGYGGHVFSTAGCAFDDVFINPRMMAFTNSANSIRYVAASNSTYSEVKWAVINFSTY